MTDFKIIDVSITENKSLSLPGVLADWENKQDFEAAYSQKK